MAERMKVGDDPAKSGGGDPNILQLKDQTKIRLAAGLEMLAWRQHTIRHADDADQVEFVVCPGSRICPLCRKPTSNVANPETGKKEARQNFPVSKRFATNVWDYGANTLKVLIAGPQVFDEFKAAKAVNIDPSSCDWIVHKMGKGIQTKYKMVRDNAAPFQFADQVGPDALIDLDKYGADTSPEKIFELLEKAGINYDAIETQTFTLDEAIEFVLPFGRCKGLTVEQALAQDQEWCEWLHGTMRDEERWAEPVFVALQTVMQSRGIVGPVDESAPPESAPANDETPVEEQTAGPAMITLIAPDGSEQEIPVEAKDALLAAGYTEKEIAEPESVEPEVTYPVMLKGPDGSEVSAPNVDAAAALEAAGFVPIDTATSDEETPEEVAPTGPTPVSPEEQVQVTIAGAAVAMTFKAALATAKAGTPVEFDDSNTAEYAEMLISTGGEPEAPKEQAEQSQAEHDMHAEAQEPQAEISSPDPDKPFACQVPGCGWAGKTQGSLTQHMNKQHPDQDAAPADTSNQQPSPAAVSGDAEVRDRVKKLLSDKPTKDYKKLLALFDEVAGKRDISKFTDDELLKLEAKLKEG